MSKTDIIPPVLKKGDKIAFISPSNRLNVLFSTRLARAELYFQTQGFQTTTIFTPDLTKNYSTSLLQRASEIHDAFADPSIKAIVCTIGGLSANSLLPHLDYNLIAANPKILVGYSDITVLHHAIYTKTGLRTFYGPAAIPQFGEYPEPMSFTSTHFFRTLMGEEGVGGEGENARVVPRSERWCSEWVDWLSERSESRTRSTTPSPPWKWLKKGRARAKLYGGCLPSLVQLTGTEYLPSGFYHGKILVLETPEMGAPNAPFPVEFARCAMVDLRNAGVLQGVVGLVLGRPFMYDEEMTRQFETMIVDVCYDLDFPILSGVDVGHTDPVLTLPLGALASLDSERDEFMLE